MSSSIRLTQTSWHQVITICYDDKVLHKICSKCFVIHRREDTLSVSVCICLCVFVYLSVCVSLSLSFIVCLPLHIHMPLILTRILSPTPAKMLLHPQFAPLAQHTPFPYFRQAVSEVTLSYGTSRPTKLWQVHRLISSTQRPQVTNDVVLHCRRKPAWIVILYLSRSAPTAEC